MKHRYMSGSEPPKLERSGYFCTLLPTCALHWQEGVFMDNIVRVLYYPWCIIADSV